MIPSRQNLDKYVCKWGGWQDANAVYTGWMSERSKERDSRAANDFKTVWLRKAVLAHERVRSFACAMHSWVRTPLQPTFFWDVKCEPRCELICLLRLSMCASVGCEPGLCSVGLRGNVAHVTTGQMIVRSQLPIIWIIFTKVILEGQWCVHTKVFCEIIESLGFTWIYCIIYHIYLHYRY